MLDCNDGDQSADVHHSPQLSNLARPESVFARPKFTEIPPNLPDDLRWEQPAVVFMVCLASDMITAAPCSAPAGDLLAWPCASALGGLSPHR